MTPEQWQQLLSTLGDAGSQIYAAATRQAAIEAYTALIFLLFCTLWAVMSVILATRSYKANNDIVMVWLVVLFFATVFGTAVTGKVYTYFVNPQWAVYETIASLMQ